MSTERDAVEALRSYMVIEERIKEQKKELTEELKAAWEALEHTLESVGQEELFRNDDAQVDA